MTSNHCVHHRLVLWETTAWTSRSWNQGTLRFPRALRSGRKQRIFMSLPTSCIKWCLKINFLPANNHWFNFSSFISPRFTVTCLEPHLTSGAWQVPGTKLLESNHWRLLGLNSSFGVEVFIWFVYEAVPVMLFSIFMWAHLHWVLPHCSGIPISKLRLKRFSFCQLICLSVLVLAKVQRDQQQFRW